MQSAFLIFAAIGQRKKQRKKDKVTIDKCASAKCTQKLLSRVVPGHQRSGSEWNGTGREVAEHVIGALHAGVCLISLLRMK